MNEKPSGQPPLHGLRVLEIGHFVAAPFCTRLLGDLGTDIIKIEPFKGDPVRQWGEQLRGQSLWWSVHGRNKRSIALDLKSATAPDLVLRLAATLMGRPEIIADPRFAGNVARVAHVKELDGEIARWTQKLTASELKKLLDDADIPSTKAFTAEDAATDPQYRSRGMVGDVNDPLLGPVLHPGIVPHIPESPGSIRWSGPNIGQHTDEILAELCEFDKVKISSLRRDRVVA
jgi:crotonobetainyl-CoA:carnitine CoA-transferase CaiB-like acyl-CoA transferase